MTGEQRPKRLYKDPTDKKISGVASGIAKYFGMDPTVVRVLWVVSFLFFGVGLVPYIILAIVLQDEPQAPPS